MAKQMANLRYSRAAVILILMTFSSLLSLIKAESCHDISKINDWHIALRSTNSTLTSLYDLWTSSDSMNDDNCALWSVDETKPGVVKSAFVDSSWHKIETVRLTVYKNGQQIMFTEFDALGSTKMDWMSRARITDSNYTDLTTYTGTLAESFFSVEGLDYMNVKRRFHMVASHNDCDDMGWFYVLDGTTKQCPYESAIAEDFPLFFVNSITTVTNLDSNIVMGDVFMLLFQLDLISMTQFIRPISRIMFLPKTVKG